MSETVTPNELEELTANQRQQLSRGAIIEAIVSGFGDDPAVYALWLEGADSTDSVDEYSDIDFWLDVEDEAVEEVFEKTEQILHRLGPIDFRHQIDHPHPKIRHRVYHLENTSEYMKLDVCIQFHSRSMAESTFVIGDPIECPKVIFDKANVIRFETLDEDTHQKMLQSRIQRLIHQFDDANVRKYIKRNEFLEALAYYQRYVIEPLVEMLRILHTPLHPDYGPVHISRHLPKETVAQLEQLQKISSNADLLQGCLAAQHLFDETLAMAKVAMLRP